MKETVFLTKSKARLRLVSTNEISAFNWIFLPGGPGLGSESLNELIALLSYPGNRWQLDLPGDGSNRTDNDTEAFSHWQEALIEAVSALPNVILVAHSSGGMFALATPVLENRLKGLVLVASAPNALFHAHFEEYMKNHPLLEVARLQKIYDKHPTDDHLKQLTIACAPYFSTEKSLHAIVSMLKNLFFSVKPYSWTGAHFHETYVAQWIPETLPTLILTGDQDEITPLKFFKLLESFKRDNIVIREIKNASHFPWFDNPADVKNALEEFIQNIYK